VCVCVCVCVCVSVRTTEKDGDIRRRTRKVVTEGTAKVTLQYTFYRTQII